MSRRAEKAIDKLLNQLSHLAEATESNNQISKLIFKEVSAESRRQVGQRGPQKPTIGHVDSHLPVKEDGVKLSNLIRSQSQILEEHKIILSEVELASKDLKSQKSILTGNFNFRFSSDFKLLIEQFIDGLSEYQNLVSILIHQNDHIQKNLRNSKVHMLNNRNCLCSC